MFALLAVAARGHVPVVHVAGPQDDWCAVIDGAIGNDLVMLEPGVYQGPCAIVAEVADVDEEITVVQPFDPADPPVFLPGEADHVLSVSGHRLELFQLAFADLPPGVDAVRVDGIRELHVRHATFTRIPGAGVRMRGGVEDRLGIEKTRFTDVGVAAEIGCPDGSCVVGAFATGTNLLERVELGFVVGPGSPGELRDDVAVGGGTAVRLHGGAGVTIEGGLYEGAGPVVEILGGPATLRSSIVLGADLALAAPGATDVEVLGSTILGPLDLAGWGPDRGLRFLGNALDRALPPLDGVDTAGTVPCPDPAACFTDPAGWDFYPAPGSPLLAAGVADPALPVDWCEHPRGAPPTAGALEAVAAASAGPLAIDFKDELACAEPEDPPGTTTPGTTTPPGSAPPPPDGGCGCRGGGAPGPLALALFAVSRRRRRAPTRAPRPAPARAAPRP